MPKPTANLATCCATRGGLLRPLRRFVAATSWDPASLAGLTPQPSGSGNANGSSNWTVRCRLSWPESPDGARGSPARRRPDLLGSAGGVRVGGAAAARHPAVSALGPLLPGRL